MLNYINIDLIHSGGIVIEVVGVSLLAKEFYSRPRYTLLMKEEILSKDEETPPYVYETGHTLLEKYFKEKYEKQRENWGFFGSIFVAFGLILQLIALNI